MSVGTTMFVKIQPYSISLEGLPRAKRKFAKEGRRGAICVRGGGSS